jgi:hypothetical protein
VNEESALFSGSTGVVDTTPQLKVSATTLAFGNVTVNSPATLPVILTSTGTAPVTVSAPTLSGAGFSVSGATFPVTLNPNQANQALSAQVQFHWPAQARRQVR